MTKSAQPDLFITSTASTTLFTNIAAHNKTLRDPEFPIRSSYALQVLDGRMIDDRRGGSYCIRRNVVIGIAMRYGLKRVNYMGICYWSDDASLPDTDSNSVS
jgi:hypothetical protein